MTKHGYLGHFIISSGLALVLQLLSAGFCCLGRRKDRKKNHPAEAHSAADVPLMLKIVLPRCAKRKRFRTPRSFLANSCRRTSKVWKQKEFFNMVLYACPDRRHHHAYWQKRSLGPLGHREDPQLWKARCGRVPLPTGGIFAEGHQQQVGAPWFSTMAVERV